MIKRDIVTEELEFTTVKHYSIDKNKWLRKPGVTLSRAGGPLTCCLSSEGCMWSLTPQGMCALQSLYPQHHYQKHLEKEICSSPNSNNDHLLNSYYVPVI